MWTTAKVVSLCLIFLLEFLFGTLGCLMVKCLSGFYGASSRFQRVMSMLNCFTGGVFFSTSILHLLPEAREQMDKSFERIGVDTGYPAAEVLAGIGFLMILFIETMAKTWCGRGSHQHSLELKTRSLTALPDTSVNSTPHESENVSSYGSIVRDQEPIVTNANIRSSEVKSAVKEDATYQDHQYLKEEPSKCNDQHTGKEENNSYHSSTMLRGLFLLVALSIHMVFDGLALGLLDDDGKVWTLLVALSIHKVLVFFTLGMQVYEAVASVRQTLITITFLAIISPIGVWIGVAITTDDTTDVGAVAIGTLQSLTAGTFLYVTFFEILQREFSESQGGVVMATVTSVGFLLVAAVKLSEDCDDAGTMDKHVTEQSLLTSTVL